MSFEVAVVGMWKNCISLFSFLEICGKMYEVEGTKYSVEIGNGLKRPLEKFFTLEAIRVG